MRLRLNDSCTTNNAQEHRASIFLTPPSDTLSCSETVVFSLLGPILNKISSSRSNRSNHKPGPCLVSQTRLAQEQGVEVRVNRPLTRFAPLSIPFFTQVLDLVEDLAKIHNSSLSKRTRCSETLPPILILRLQQAALRLVCLSIFSWHFLF